VTPFKALNYASTFITEDFGAPGFLYQYLDHVMPENCYGMVMVKTAEFEASIPITMEMYNNNQPNLKISFTSTTKVYPPGSILGCIFLRPGDGLRRTYNSSDAGAFATVNYTLFVFNT